MAVVFNKSVKQFICDTESERSFDFGDGALVYCKDTDKLYYNDSGSWVLVNGGGSSTVYDVVGITIDGAGQAITTGSKGFRRIEQAATITGWTIIAKESGSCVIDVKKGTYTALFTTSSIAGTEKPTLSSAQKNQDVSLTTWTTSLSADDVLEFVVDSASTVTRVTVFIHITKG